MDLLSDFLHWPQRRQAFVIYASLNWLFDSRKRNAHCALVIDRFVVEECKGPVGKERCGVGQEAKLRCGRSVVVEVCAKCGDLPFEQRNSAG